jgi:hypothetical protein
MPARKSAATVLALALLTVSAPARAATIQWDFFGVSDTPVVVVPTVNDTAKFSVAGYFDYDTATNALALLPDPFAYQVYENGILADNCCGGLIPGSGATFSDNTISLSSAVLPLFTLTALKPLDGSSPIMPGSGFAFVIAPFGTSTTGAFVEAKTLPPPPPPSPGHCHVNLPWSA